MSKQSGANVSLFEELRKRHLLQIALVYVGAGWVCIEIADFIVGNYGFSRKILDTVVFLAILGFPAFMVIGWFHGQRGPQHVQRAERWLLLTLVSLGAIGTYRIATAEEVSAGPTDRDAAAPPVSRGAQPVSNESLPDLGRRSLAVLPFKNNVADEDLAWLGPGLADLLTTNFAQIPDMRVVGRQSLYDLLTEEGRSEDEEIPEALALTLARNVGARMMLWGTVTGTADDMRIDAQMTELETGTILFAESVRGSDVFALVDSLTQKLAVRLSGDRPAPRTVRISQLGTHDMEAMGAFQHGIAAERAGRIDEAEAHFERAASIDTTFVLPLVRLASGEDAFTVEAQDFEWLSMEMEDVGAHDVDVEELGQAYRAGLVSDEDLDEIARVAEFDGETREELARMRANQERNVAALHKRRALRLLDRMGTDFAAQFEGLSQEQVLARLDSIMGRALSSVRVIVGDIRRDSLGRPIAPRRGGRPPRDPGGFR